MRSSAGPDGEVVIDETCIGCGNCQRNCPYGVIRLDAKPPEKPSLWQWLLFGKGPGPGEASYSWRKDEAEKQGIQSAKLAIKCDMCSGIDGGPALRARLPDRRCNPSRAREVPHLHKAGAGGC